MITLGIETSCDETSIALVADGTSILANIVSSQIEIHRRFGGVVPEIASRKHLESISPLLREALSEARIEFRQIDQIAVTMGPGLVGALMVGIATAKALSWALKIPLLPVNHIEAHLSAGFLALNKPPSYPFLGLIVSGGHSNLVVADGNRKFELLGRTLDDAPGELFDKISRKLSLGYPGGPAIQKTGEGGDPMRYNLPRPMLGQGFAFSFSGLKTAALNLIRSEGEKLNVCDLCAALQAAVAETFSKKVVSALEKTGISRLVVSGGVAANKLLREYLAKVATKAQIELLIPPPQLCTDNAAMIASNGFFDASYWENDTTGLSVKADWQMGDNL
ncbi:tRNA (adenosine(37)-N6)-threonylcarbamoyltransferase complex transferase subunit TsaD [bacterium]|nr:tRNA (adenosine(37)-N6)-threonylcarbamoyltransferase complex transferase subunit TsaD [bacterium]